MGVCNLGAAGSAFWVLRSSVFSVVGSVFCVLRSGFGVLRFAFHVLRSTSQNNDGRPTDSITTEITKRSIEGPHERWRKKDRACARTTERNTTKGRRTNAKKEILKPRNKERKKEKGKRERTK